MIWEAEVNAAVAATRRLHGVSIDPALVHAVIERETRHRAYPLAGTLEPHGHRSYGPMQVKDTTAALHGIYDPASLNTPSLGIRIGTFELARLTRLFPGDTSRVIAAYNEGAAGAARDPVSHFRNQSYVDAVLGFLARYKGVAVVTAPVAGLIALAALLWFATRRRRLALR